MAGAAMVSGVPTKAWTVVGQHDGVVDESAFCQDQLQTPPVPETLLRQPPVTATTRPPDNVTADWCSNIVFKPTGEIARFVVWAPPIPLKVGAFTLSADSATQLNTGHYRMQITYLQTRDLEFTESCLTAQGVRLSCPALGRRLGEFLAAEANIYSVRCFDPADPSQGGCDCQYDVSFIGGPSGRWFSDKGSTSITLFDDFYNPASVADYCVKGDGSIDLTGHDTTALFNQTSYRTMHLVPASCHDGVQNIGEDGVDCGAVCGNACGTCSDGMQNGDEDGIDCGGSCLGVLCENPDQVYTAEQKKTRKAACANGVKEKWEEGVDCGGPCKTADGPKLCTQ
ncbi:MAG TPA: hypothetical protein VHJ20_21880 [Polyangia bacterium]|nr:hypothetical protein [Polyangia bacterium]